MAAAAGSPVAAGLVAGDLAADATGTVDALALSRLAHRVVAYVERTARVVAR